MKKCEELVSVYRMLKISKPSKSHYEDCNDYSGNEENN